jgi:Zn-dependent M28 family amino/carboxypeptidase
MATPPGTGNNNQYYILSGIFVAWYGAAGANDNGAGTLIVMEAMRILKRVLPHPQRTILAGHWTGEEEGLVGSRAFSEDHPEVVKGLQFMFNHDLGTGRVNRIHGAGLPDAAAHLEQWLARLPPVFQEQVKFEGTGQPSGGSSDHAPFNCAGAPAMLLGSVGWDYGKYDGHTNRDSYDKVVYDDIRSDAVLLAMLAYLASEDPSRISRERAPGAWPACQAAPRHTRPRLR